MAQVVSKCATTLVMIHLAIWGELHYKGVAAAIVGEQEIKCLAAANTHVPLSLALRTTYGLLFPA